MSSKGYEPLSEDEYTEAHEAAQLGMLLINTVETHEPLQAAQIAYLFRDQEISSGGKVTWASAHLASLQGAAAKYWGRYFEWSLYRLVGFEPDFVMLIDRHIWAGLDEREKLAVVDHELCHMTQARDEFGGLRFNQVTAAPIWVIRPHDVEEFTEVVDRHGAWSASLVSMARSLIDALNNGPALAVPQTGT